MNKIGFYVAAILSGIFMCSGLWVGYRHLAVNNVDINQKVSDRNAMERAQFLRDEIRFQQEQEDRNNKEPWPNARGWRWKPGTVTRGAE